MERLIPGLIVVVIVVLIFLVMWRAWVRRQRDAAHFPALTSTLEREGSEICETSALYVSTTPLDQPMERLALPGLSYRGFCTISVRDTGILITIPGEAPVALSVDRLLAVNTAQLTIDKAVERGGLVALSWVLPGAAGASTSVDSYFRVAEPAEKDALIGAISSILSTPASSTHSAQEA